MNRASIKQSKKVLVGISSGIDSTYALIKLKEHGYSPVALFLNTGFNESAISDAHKICDRLGVELNVVDVKKEFEDSVIEKTKNFYLNGKTPNPCTFCNPDVKFRFLFKKADSLGVHLIATGHYATVKKTDNGYFLCQAQDLKKDQSYFLYELLNMDLERIIFPLADVLKTDVLKKLKDYFPEFRRKESQDLCFVKRNYRKTLFKNRNNTGPIYNHKGEEIGKHNGLWNYTIGQREGISVKAKGPWYVYRIDRDKNAIFVGPRDFAMKKEVRFELKTPPELIESNTGVVFKAKIRYNQGKLDVEHLSACNGSVAEVSFKSKAFAPAPGQAIVLYAENRVIGGGILL